MPQGHVPHPLVPCRAMQHCNRAKSAREVAEFLEHSARVANHAAATGLVEAWRGIPVENAVVWQASGAALPLVAR